MAVSSSSPTTPQSRRGRRYSLRALLIFLTLVCVGLWYWYRVPFVREVSQRAGGYYWKEASGRVEPGKEIQRYRRVLVGEPLREGRTELFDKKGNRIGEENWREGGLHGPSIRWYTTGRVRQTGEHSRGRKSGLWEHFDESGRPAARISYEAGLPHGAAEFFVDGEPFDRLQYEHGVVTQIAGRPFNDPLGRAFPKNMEGSRIADALWIALNRQDFREMTIGEAVDDLRTIFKISIVIDRTATLLASNQTTLNIEGAPLHSLLVLLPEPHGLAADYRFGAIWITTKADAANWIDRTGIDQLLGSPPPGTRPDDIDRLRAALQTPVYIDFLDMPAPEAAEHLGKRYGISLVVDESLNETPLSM